MKINVPHVAKLADLKLKENEIEKFEKQLSEILNYIEKLNKIDTKSIDQTSQVTGLKNVMRQDKSKLSFSQTDALSQTKSKHNGLFKVKAILEE